MHIWRIDVHQNCRRHIREKSIKRYILLHTELKKIFEMLNILVFDVIIFSIEKNEVKRFFNNLRSVLHRIFEKMIQMQCWIETIIK
jgi:hypothetical protein